MKYIGAVPHSNVAYIDRVIEKNEVVLKNEGLANKDLAKFETQIQNLADKWDR